MKGLNSFTALGTLTFDPAHGVDDHGSVPALGTPAPKGLHGLEVAVQVRVAGRLAVVDHVFWRALVCEGRTLKERLSQSAALCLIGHAIKSRLTQRILKKMDISIPKRGSVTVDRERQPDGVNSVCPRSPSK